MIAADELSQEEKEIVCLTLALMYRTSWIEKVARFDGSDIRTTWKGYDFRVLNMLEDLDLIDSGKRRGNKSASFTEGGESPDAWPNPSPSTSQSASFSSRWRF